MDQEKHVIRVISLASRAGFTWKMEIHLYEGGTGEIAESTLLDCISDEEFDEIFVEGLEDLILAHAVAGVDVESYLYVAGIDKVVDNRTAIVPEPPKTEEEIAGILLEVAVECGATLEPIEGERTNRGGQLYRLKNSHGFFEQLVKTARKHDFRYFPGGLGGSDTFTFFGWEVILVGDRLACFLRIDPVG
jgi:hypothetical protein